MNDYHPNLDGPAEPVGLAMQPPASPCQDASEPPQRRHSQWLNRQPFILSAETHQGFKHVKKVLNCKLCGHILQVGDKARWIYANGTPGMGTGNFFVCGDCDGEDAVMLAKAKEQFTMAVTLAKRWGIYGPDWQH